MRLLTRQQTRKANYNYKKSREWERRVRPKKRVLTEEEKKAWWNSRTPEQKAEWLAKKKREEKREKNQISRAIKQKKNRLLNAIKRDLHQ